MGDHGEWVSSDQIPQRAVASGQLDRYGFVDPTNGGKSHRYSLSTQGFQDLERGRLDYSAYALDYRLQLFSNFTYNLNSVEGDQFEQFDDRNVYGGARPGGSRSRCAAMKGTGG